MFNRNHDANCPSHVSLLSEDSSQTRQEERGHVFQGIPDGAGRVRQALPAGSPEVRQLQGEQCQEGLQDRPEQVRTNGVTVSLENNFNC